MPVNPALYKANFVATAGAIQKSTGYTSASANDTILAMGFKLNYFTFSSDMKTLLFINK